MRSEDGSLVEIGNGGLAFQFQFQFQFGLALLSRNASADHATVFFLLLLNFISAMS